MNNENQVNNVSTLHFPIVLGEHRSARVVIIHLIHGQDNYKEKRVVITERGVHNNALFKIPQQVKIIDTSGQPCGNPVWHCRGKADTLTVKIGGETIKPKTIDSKYIGYFIGSDRFDGIVEFEYAVKEKEKVKKYVGRIHIVRLAVSDRLVKLTADLGSDATQVNYAINDNRVNPVFIIENMMNEYTSRNYPPKTTDSSGAVFVQEEKDQPAYFKTGNISFKDGGYIDKGLNDENTFINYLEVSAAGKSKGYSGGETITIESGFTHKLVNIKMLYAEIGDNNNGNVANTVAFGFRKGDETKTTLIRTPDELIEILRTIYKQIIEVSTKQKDVDGKYYSVMLLVPNIYNQSSIDDLLYYLNDLMNEDYDNGANQDGEKKPKENTKLYDFRVISESDSAFIGLNEVGDMEHSLLEEFLTCKEKITEKKKKDRFLIIDSGKGTTDYSIINYGGAGNDSANNSISSVKRGGIVGAGGAIDYVLARVFARQIFRHKEEIVSTDSEKWIENESVFTERFMNLISSLAPRDQDRFMLLIETLKKSYNGDTVASMYSCFIKDKNKNETSNEAHFIIDYLIDKTKTFKEALEEIKSKDTIVSFEQLGKTSLIEDDYNREKVQPIDKEEVDSICRLIATAIIDKMVFLYGNTTLTKKIDYVIFTGRSFLFEPLKKAFFQAINRKSEKGFSYRGRYLENTSPIKYGKESLELMLNRNMDKEKLYNLKVAELDGLEKLMKSISIRYNNHNLGVNCNSDLCCLDGLSGPNKEVTMKLERFWNGFKGVGYYSKFNYYYIGYRNTPFATNDTGFIGRQNRAFFNRVPSKIKDPLINMTLFPVRYVKVDVVKAYKDACKKTNADIKSSDGDNDHDTSDGGKRKKDFRRRKGQNDILSGTEKTDPVEIILDDINEIDNPDEYERKDL